jgi:hypothetical protein
VKIIYDNHQEIYLVKIEELETVTMIHTNDIVEAREEFVKCMTRLFNDAICEKLTDRQGE